MKKRIAAILAVSVAVSLFSACGSGSENNGEADKSEAANGTISAAANTDGGTGDITYTDNFDTPVTTMPVVTTAPVNDPPKAASYISEIMFIGDDMCGGFSSLAKVDASMVVTSDGAKAADVAELTGKAAEKKPKFIYLWVGKNDLSYCNDYKFYSGVKSIVSDLTEKSPDSVIAVLSLPALKAGGSWDQNNCDGGASYDISIYNEVLRQVVDEADSDKVVYIDIAAPLEDDSGNLSEAYDSGDGMHINDAGYNCLAAYIENNPLSNSYPAAGTVSMPAVGGSGEISSDNETDADEDTSETTSVPSDAEITGKENLRASRAPYTKNSPKVCYLSFDDGPSENTEEILDILKENDIKATFFIVGWCVDGREEILKRIADEGHTIGIHTYSHDYEEIYSSVESYLDDFEKAYNKIYEVTGIKPWLFRYPGGSYNSFNDDIADKLIGEMNGRGFTYFDWSCATSDATVGATYNSCVESFKDSLTNDYETVLMHDSKELTVEYLQDIIDYAKGEGYKFETLDSADPIHF